MNELEKAYQEIEGWHCYAEQEGFVDEEEISYLDYVKNCINNLQSKIDKARKIIDRYSRVIDYNDEVSIDVLYEIDDVLKENK